MKRIPILTVAIATLFFVSCKNSGTTGLPIPKDAAIVVHINSSSLTSKLSWKEIKESEWFQEMYKKEQDSFSKKIMDNPDNSGVDIKSDFVMFMKKEGKSGVMVFEGKIKDEAAFEATVKKAGHSEIKKDGDLKYTSDGGSSLMSWNGKTFIMMTDLHMGSRYENDEYVSNEFSSDSLRLLTKNLLSLSGSNSLESSDHFSALLKDKGDVHYYMNQEYYFSLFGNTMSSMFKNSPLSMVWANFSKLTKGSESTGTFSFDDGKITIKTKQYYGAEMAKILDKHEFGNVSEDQINRIPSNDVTGAMFVNFPPEVLGDLVKATNLDGILNSEIGKMGLSLDELVAAMKGQVVFAVSDLGAPSATQPMGPDGQPKMDLGMKILLGVSVRNKATFDKLINIGMSEIKDSAERKAMLSMVNFRTTNDWFAVSNSQDVTDRFLAGGTIKQPFADRIKGHPVAMFFDIQKIIKGISAREGSTGSMMDVSMKTWQDIVVTGGDYKNGISEGLMEINMVDKKTNSLKQLNSYIQQMYLAQKKDMAEIREKYQMDAPMSDTATVESAPN
jgi:hypothetical protein